MESTQLTYEAQGSTSLWNHAPKRLWKRLSIHLRPDIHTVSVENGENFTITLNNVLAHKYGLPPCTDDNARKLRRLSRLQRTAAELDHEIAALSSQLLDDHLVPGLRAELEGQRAEFVAAREERERAEAETVSRAERIRSAVDELVAVRPLERFSRALPENDPSGDRIDDWDLLLAAVARQCGGAVDPSEVAAEVRRRAAAAGGEP